MLWLDVFKTVYNVPLFCQLLYSQYLEEKKEDKHCYCQSFWVKVTRDILFPLAFLLSDDDISWEGPSKQNII